MIYAELNSMENIMVEIFPIPLDLFPSPFIDHYICTVPIISHLIFSGLICKHFDLVFMRGNIFLHFIREDFFSNV